MWINNWKALAKFDHIQFFWKLSMEIGEYSFKICCTHVHECPSMIVNFWSVLTSTNIKTMFPFNSKLSNVKSNYVKIKVL